ncbi:E3 ubiquitin-protein ligase TRIM39-like [Halichoeres trimaculatus]|uniref:E3 ubiquitin-protein ligase TRIM39-like n=1 Tax=Halichoeres trimaculatus TaxID=147232 RepID=UPI003D9E2305
MASSSLFSEEQFLCPICLDMFTQPVSTPCGHNFCKSCISTYWRDLQVCQCPVCKETFERRPDLKVNTFISELSSQLESLKVLSADVQRPVQELASRGGVVLCDVCSENQQTAVKSCLECLTSYCAAHLEPHHRAAGLKRHRLLEPTSNLEERICKEHTRLLSMFCRMEDTLLCDLCFSLNHSEHNVISVQQAYVEAKAALGMREDGVQQMMKRRQQKVTELKELVEKSKTETKTVIAGSVQELAGLVSEIQQSQAELVQVMEEKQKAAEEKAGAFFTSVKKEMKELERVEAKIRELKEAEDPVCFLLHVPEIYSHQHRMNSLEFSFGGPVEIHRLQKCLSKTVPKLHKLLKEMNAEIKELSSKTEEPNDTYLRFQRQYVVDISLDPSTAHPQLIVSHDRKQVKYDERRTHKRHKSPNRFTSKLAVLGDTALSYYKFYFEVSVGRKTEWCLGMAEKSIQRFGAIPRKPGCGLWAIWFKEDRFETLCNPNVSVHHGRVEQVGVYVHYQNNSIHFYDVKTLTTIHEFTKCSFTEELYPYLNPCNNEYGSNLEPMVLIPVKRTLWM